MKYFYKILRLFKCPHKFSKLLDEGTVKNRFNGTTMGNYYVKECQYCGVVKEFNTSK